MIGIITDSTCDIPQSLVEQYGIHVVPQILIWGDRQYLDRIDLQPEEFYQRLLTDPLRPTTSQSGIKGFQQMYQKAIQQGADEIIVITVSSKMSGTYQVALEAAETLDIPVHVVDSKNPTMGLGWQVLAAARANAAGASVAQILSEIERVRERVVLVVGLDTLAYLQRGGRIGNAAKWVGGVLQVKPVVVINHNTGLVEPVSLARTHRGVVETMYDKFFELLGTGSRLHLSVLHGNSSEQAALLVERIQAEFHPYEIWMSITGPVLGLHTGPGALALAGYMEV